MKKHIGIVGGDLRQRYLIDALQMPVVFYGNESICEREDVIKSHNLSELLLECDTIVVPIPFSKDQQYLNTRYCTFPISINTFLDSISSKHIVIGGPFSNDVTQKIQQKGAKIIDITALETFKMKNAVPTAEGVISEMIIKSDVTIHSSKALVLGYGYCGKRITKSIDDLGAVVDVYTENDFEKRVVSLDGFTLLNEIKGTLSYDFIINTIPKFIITEGNVIESKLLIDITEVYKADEINLIKMRGIPGRYSPKTAGIIIGELLNDLIKSVTGENC